MGYDSRTDQKEILRGEICLNLMFVKYCIRRGFISLLDHNFNGTKFKIK